VNTWSSSSISVRTSSEQSLIRALSVFADAVRNGVQLGTAGTYLPLSS
jgi:hypothetical protein